MLKITEPKKVLCIHDLSGVGRCSLAVILPAVEAQRFREQARGRLALRRLTEVWSTPRSGVKRCLMEFVRGDIFQGSVEKYIADAAKKLGGSIKFVDAVRFQTGEGIEKKEEDFAAEVAAQMNMGKK